MRKYLTITAAVLLVAVGSVLAVVFTAGASDASPSAATITSASATVDQVKNVLQPIVQAGKNAGGGSAAYSLTVTPVASSTAPTSGPLAALFSGGVTVSGTVKADQSAKAFDVTVAASLGSSSTPLVRAEVYWNGTQGWVKYGGTWYDLPPKAVKKIQQAEARQQQDAAASAAMKSKLHKLATTLGIDPQKWITDLTMGTGSADQLTQISAGIDVQQIASDAVKLVQSSEFQKLADQELARIQARAQGEEAAAAAKAQARLEQISGSAKLTQLPSEAAQVIQDPQVTLWVDQNAKSFQKFQLALTVVPPAQAKAPVKSADVKFTVDNINLGATTVTPSTPVTGAQPWSVLQQQLKMLQQMFGGARK